MTVGITVGQFWTKKLKKKLFSRRWYDSGNYRWTFLKQKIENKTFGPEDSMAVGITVGQFWNKKLEKNCGAEDGMTVGITVGHFWSKKLRKTLW